MMHSLIIKYHPRKDGTTHTIASHYRENQISLGNTAEILDINTSEFFQEYPVFDDDGRHFKKTDITMKIQSLIDKADELVFIFPIWWGSAPATMKNFIDCNITSGFAYQYKKWWSVDKLLKGKSGKIFVTSWGPKIYTFFCLLFPWLIGIFFFTGLKISRIGILADMRKLTPERKEKFLRSL
jgi:NAD(P)H dehydrogenase (quinone)